MSREQQTMSTNARAEPTRASVCAGGVSTSYLRAGRGSAIVMLTPDLDDASVLEMLGTLARTHLVVAAVPGVASMALLGPWLRDFIEGLGLDEAHLLLHPAISAMLGA